MFLERWIVDQIEEGSDLEEFKLSRLRKMVDYAASESPFYRDLFNQHGAGPRDIRGMEDLHRLPFTTAAHLREKPYKMPCISLSKVKRVFSLYTGGTSGDPKIVFFSEKDLDRSAEYMGVAMKSVAEAGGISKPDFRVYILLPDGKPQSQQKMLAWGVEKIGAVPVLGDLALNSQEQIERIEQTAPDIVFGPVSRIYRITQECKDSRALDKMGVSILFMTSEYIPPAMRQRVQDLWETRVFGHYGMTEMGWAGGIECQFHDGFHFNEADVLLEVVDPETGRPLTDGEEGELVLTTLNREAMPLIRYRTGDLGTIISDRCNCGASRLRRIGRLIKRRDSLVKLAGGDEINPNMLDDALHEVPSVISYQCSLVQEESRERLDLKVELTADQVGVEDEIRRTIRAIPPVEKNIEAGLMAEPDIEVVDQSVLKRRGRSKKLISDERPQTG